MVAYGRVLGLSLFLACQGPYETVSEPRLARDTLGDTIIVRNLAGSVWGTVVLSEELQVGPEVNTSDSTSLIAAIAPDDFQGVYVFEPTLPGLFYFDSTGTHTRTIGRTGAGPGEYSVMIIGLAVRTDGQVLLADPRNGRIVVYGPHGIVKDHWSIPVGYFAPQGLSVDTADHTYVRISLNGRDGQKEVMLHFDADGQVLDTIRPQIVPLTAGARRPPFSPRHVWAVGPFGEVVEGESSEYRFLLRQPHGEILVVTKSWRPVPVRDEEVEGWRALNPGTKAEIPKTKPAFRRFDFDTEGRIWVQRHAPGRRIEETSHIGKTQGRWGEPAVFDVFGRNGDFLGEVRFPPRTTLAAFGPGHPWGIRYGSLGEQVVVRLGPVP